VKERGARGDGRASIGHGLERVVLDLHALGAVLGEVAVIGHDGGDRLAHVADLIVGQQRVTARSERRVIDDGGNLFGRVKIAPDEDAHHPGDGAGRGGVDPKACVGMDAADERDVTRAGQTQVVEERGLAAQQPCIFQALEGLSGESRGHGRGRAGQL